MSLHKWAEVSPYWFSIFLEVSLKDILSVFLPHYYIYYILIFIHRLHYYTIITISMIRFAASYNPLCHKSWRFLGWEDSEYHHIALYPKFLFCPLLKQYETQIPTPEIAYVTNQLWDSFSLGLHSASESSSTQLEEVMASWLLLMCDMRYMCLQWHIFFVLTPEWVPCHIRLKAARLKGSLCPRCLRVVVLGNNGASHSTSSRRSLGFAWIHNFWQLTVPGQSSRNIWVGTSSWTLPTCEILNN